MTDKQKKLTEIVCGAIEEFNRNEGYLVSRDVSERCICSKFARYLEDKIKGTEFSHYIVDVEYNRGAEGNEYAAKVLRGHNIVVDLIVHKRGYSRTIGFDNLICIEMKKAYKRVDLTADRLRLSVMTNSEYDFNYDIGFMIIAYADKKNDKYGLRVESVFLEGKCFPIRI